MLKKIPYAISSFRELRDLNMYYIDKTKYIEILENKVRYQFFIRPRRFGRIGVGRGGIVDRLA